ncbi:MAG: hypothetical protein Q9163_005607 [Psora crenata]
MDPDQQDKYAIHEAAREGRTTAVESLLRVYAPYPINEQPNSVQANHKLANVKDDDERLPVHWAVAYNHQPIVELLVSREDFDPDVQDASGWTPLMIASSLKDEDGSVDLLLSKGADVNMKTNNGQTALHLTTSKSNLSIARKLLAHGASARVKDKQGQLPLHRAAAIGSVPLIELMLENRTPLNATDVSGLSALHHAISEGHGDAALALLRAGAESDKRDSDGYLAIDLAPDKKIRKYILQAAEREEIEVTMS